MNSLEAAPISGSQSQSQSHDQSHDQSLTLTLTPEPVPSQSQPQHIRKQLTWITLCAILICGATGLATVLNIAVLTSCTYWKERNVDIGAFTIGMLQVCQSSLKYATIDFYIDNCDQAPDDVIKSACYRSNAEHILQVIAICIGFIATLLTLYVCFVMSRRLGPSKPPFSSTNMQTFQRIILITFPMLIITFGACFTSFILMQIDYRTHIQLVVTNISTSSPVSVSGKIADFYTFDATFGLHIIAWLLLFFCVIVSCIFYFLSRRVRRSLTSDGMLFTVNDQMGTEISNVQPTFI